MAYIAGSAFTTAYNAPSIFPGSSTGAHLQAPPAPRTLYAPQPNAIAQVPYNATSHSSRRISTAASGRGQGVCNVLVAALLRHFFLQGYMWS